MSTLWLLSSFTTHTYTANVRCLLFSRCSHSIPFNSQMIQPREETNGENIQQRPECMYHRKVPKVNQNRESSSSEQIQTYTYEAYCKLSPSLHKTSETFAFALISKNIIQSVKQLLLVKAKA